MDEVHLAEYIRDRKAKGCARGLERNVPEVGATIHERMDVDPPYRPIPGNNAKYAHN